MEGWDGEPDGRPSDLTRRRWLRFAQSGAKLVWGEATAVRPDGRANPRQLVLTEATLPGFAALVSGVIDSHEAAHGSSDDLVVGLQLTHSGRFSRPEGEFRPRIAYRHPLLDERVSAGDAAVLSDDEIKRLIDDFVTAGRLAREAGFDFVDIKHCHGYLGHELLSARSRAGAYGGDLEGRTRFLRSVLEGLRHAAPGLLRAVRLSAYDFMPFSAGGDGVGRPDAPGPYDHAFGGDGTGIGVDIDEPHQLLTMLEDLGVELLSVTAGSPYYCPHIQRPAYFPPSDGYLPPSDPLVDVARLIGVTAELKARHRRLTVVGSGYSYLQEWLPNVAQRTVRDGAVDLVGLGRMMLSYPALPSDVLAGRALDRRLICRTFSDCTTGPRVGLVSGCYPLDDFYKESPYRAELTAAKQAKRQAERQAGLTAAKQAGQQAEQQHSARRRSPGS